MAHKLLEDLRSKLLARLDAVKKRRGAFQDVNAFVEFRNAAGVEPGKPIGYDGFVRALRQFGIKGAQNARLSKRAFHFLSTADGKANTDDIKVTFNHVSFS